ncbi:MAG TPA: hypothetical protein VEV63_01630 [Streptosporangiaceae bacterium]|nr:hypothetical protein [Streptosporangiaceae bacterium]
MVCEGDGLGLGVDGGDVSVEVGLGAGAGDDLLDVGCGPGALLDECVLDGALLLVVPLPGVVPGADGD